jgi:Uma2 family endonuclease
MDMPASIQRRWTRPEVLDLIERNPRHTPRYEVVDGELFVTPSPLPIHQFAVGELLYDLMAYCKMDSVCDSLTSPSDTELEPGTLVQPDVYVVSRSEGMRMRAAATGRQLLLAVEVLSPGSIRGDRGPKRYLYQRAVPDCWIVDLDARLIETWRPESVRPTLVRDRIEWRPLGASSSFMLDVKQYFARVFGEV